MNHIFFTCPLARFMWSAARELLQCSWDPSCFADLYRLIGHHKGQTKRILWICCAALCWTLWTTRNKFTIESTFPAQPIDGIYKLSMFLQVWKPVARRVARRQDREILQVTIGRIRALYLELREDP